MNFPTVLSPWFVIQSFSGGYDGADNMGCLMYYSSDEEGKALFVEEPEKAMILMSIHAATRIAAAEGAHVRLLTSKEDLKEFRRA